MKNRVAPARRLVPVTKILSSGVTATLKPESSEVPPASKKADWMKLTGFAVNRATYMSVSVPQSTLPATTTSPEGWKAMDAGSTPRPWVLAAEDRNTNSGSN